MNDKYKDKYRINSTRFHDWNYRESAAYFITICTEKQENYFGYVEKEQMVLSPLGAIANVLWYEIKHHAKNIQLGEYVVMPNHLHGILILNNEEFIEKNVKEIVTSKVMFSVETLHATSLPKNRRMSLISPKPNSISTIIRSYKSAVTKHAHRLGFEFEWQSRFYDYVIRGIKSYENISKYIIYNPVNWDSDEYNIAKRHLVLQKPKINVGVNEK